ncbi:MAG: FAD-dependent oxidoreductase, partial [Actinobacteria bacterium]|nr:FAD-dependent oxidoreductase [Actinomycetota bacterium]NIS35037.1 FAD-dependent oxidoreductase [Actinomycetota bacterium]
MSVPHVSVVGAGPAGLAAAIELARNGTQVTVYEARASVGSRFHGDFQGIENWTTADDVRDWLERLHLRLDFP